MKKATIYTTKGDDGTTQLLGGERVGKDDVRVEAYGTVDELSACIGVLQSLMCADDPQQSFLSSVQTTLFSIAAFLSDSRQCMAEPLNDATLAALEHEVDHMEASLPRLKGFLLPPVTKAAATANLCRTVCRRAERRIVALSRMAQQPRILSAYINRLSDYLFLLSRALDPQNEKIWDNPCK